MNRTASNIDKTTLSKATLGSYLVGAYLFSVPTFSYAIDLELNYIPQWLGIMIVLYAVLDFARTRKVNIPFEIRLYGLFVFWLALATLRVGVLDYYDTLLTSVKVGFITLGVAQLIKTDRDFYNALLIYGSSILFVAYLNYDTILYLKYAPQITGMDRFDGTLANANTAAIYAISVVWASFLLIFGTDLKLISKLLCVAFIGIALFINYFSGSIKGMVGIFMFVIFASWLFFEKYSYSLRMRAFVCLLGLGMFGVTVFFVFISPFYYRLEKMILYSSYGSFGDRLYLFKTAIGIWLENGINFFFGIGHDHFRDYNSLRTYSHSTISEVLVSSGIIGFFLYFGAFVLLLRNLYEQSKDSSLKIQFTTTFGCVIFLLILLFFNVAAVLYSSRDLWPIIGVIGAYSFFLNKSRQIMPIPPIEK